MSLDLCCANLPPDVFSGNGEVFSLIDEHEDGTVDRADVSRAFSLLKAEKNIDTAA